MTSIGRSAARTAGTVALIYLALGLAWIFGSDLYLYYTGTRAFPAVDLAKGAAFVAASAVVIYLLVYWQVAAVHRERLRRESAERGFRALVASTPDAVLILDPDTGEVLDANEAAETLFGRRHGELIGLKRSAHTDTNDPALHDYLEARRRAGHARAELTMVRADGTRFPADVSTAVFQDEDGRTRASVIVRDISERVRREQALEASEARLSELTGLQQAVLNAVFAHIALVDENGVVQFANARWQEGARDGALPELGADVGSNYLASCEGRAGANAETSHRLGRSVREVLSGQARRAEYEFPYVREGTREWSRIAITPFSAHGQRGAVIAHLSVTDRREAEARMRLISAAFQSTDEAILICDENFLVLEANEAHLRITGLEKADALEAKPSFLEMGDQARVVGKTLAAQGYWHGDLVQRRASGETFVSQGAINVVQQPAGEPQRLVITYTDVSGLREIERRAEHLSLHDPVTNLPNREALDLWFEQAKRGDGVPRALIYVDLDRFKTVNESFGHSFGDVVLRELAARLGELTGPRDALARLGGDEFLVVADGVESTREAERRARGLLAAIAEPVKFQSREIYTTACAGITLYPRDGLNLEELLRGADAALHAVKRDGGRGAVGTFRQEMREQVDQQLRVERGLRGAVQRGELELEFQPVIRLADRTLSGAEALVRWNSPQLGRVPPNDFISIAEDTGLIGEIGYWVFEQACQWAKKWRGLCTRFEHLSVNVSTVQFQQPGLVEQFETLLARHDVPTGSMRLEITESVMMLDPQWTVEVLNRLNARGMQIAIDDFGTGYSSLSYLRRLPVQHLKLDQNFTQRLPDSETDASIMESTILLAHRLGIQVTAEGIETQDQLDMLAGWGCDQGQGFLIARPMSADRMSKLLREGAIRFGDARGG